MPSGIPVLPSNNGPENLQRDEFVRRTWIGVFIVFGVIAFILVFWAATDIFLMAFAGALLAILLRSLANFVHRWTGLNRDPFEI